MTASNLVEHKYACAGCHGLHVARLPKTQVPRDYHVALCPIVRKRAGHYRMRHRPFSTPTQIKKTGG